MTPIAGGTREELRAHEPLRVEQPAGFDLGLFLMHRNKGREALEAGRAAEARAHLEQAVRLRPGDESALGLLGAVYFKLDLRDEAMDVFRRLVQHHPESDVLHANLGILEFKQGRLDDARRRLETAALLNPASSRPHLYLGLLEHRVGDLQACLKHLQAAGAADLMAKISARASLEPEVKGPRLALDRVLAERQVRAASDSGNLFALSPSALPGRPDTLAVDFAGEIWIREGSASSILCSGTSAGEATPPEAGLLSLRGTGRLHLASPNPQRGAVLLVQVEAGSSLLAGPRRLLAAEPAVVPAPGGRFPISRVMSEVLAGGVRLNGRGVAALSAGRNPCAITVRSGEHLIASGEDLICWTEGLSARPAAPGVLERAMASGRGPGAPVRLEGAGQVLMDLPA